MRITKLAEETLSLQDLSNKFLAYKMAQGVAPRTLKDYDNELSKFVKFSSNTLEQKQLEEDVINYFLLIPNTSTAVYNRPYSCLNSFFNWAIKRKLILQNPFFSLSLKKKKEDETIHAASIEDIKLLLKACDKKTFTGLRNYTIINLMLDTGVRTNELVQLLDEDYNPNTNTITVRREVAKTSNSRILYLSKSVSLYVGKLIKLKPEGWSKNIFPSREGNQLDTNELSREFRKLSNKAGVKITPYQLRHSFATYAVANGINVFELQRLMGHSDIRMTKRYTDIVPEKLEQSHNQYSPIKLIEQKKRITNV